MSWKMWLLSIGICRTCFYTLNIYTYTYPWANGPPIQRNICFCFCLVWWAFHSGFIFVPTCHVYGSSIWSHGGKGFTFYAIWQRRKSGKSCKYLSKSLLVRNAEEQKYAWNVPKKRAPWRARSCRVFYRIYYLSICFSVNLCLSLKIINSW